MSAAGQSIAAWAAVGLSTGDHLSAPSQDIPRAHLLALARYAGLGRETTKRYLASVDAYWGGPTETGHSVTPTPLLPARLDDPCA
eukprot:5307983-Alexandrium_andersonii.AAC.1